VLIDHEIYTKPVCYYVTVSDIHFPCETIQFLAWTRKLGLDYYFDS